MQKITPDDPETRSADILGANIGQLKAFFPDAVTEGRIDFEVLRQLLGDEVDEREEKYGLRWHGKRRARQIALTPSTGTLRPCLEESVDWDNTQNLVIEGDSNMLAAWGIDFPYPKPLLLVQYLIQVFSRHDASDLIVDFFAGSGTTGHAVFAQNASDAGNRRWIAVQYPEPIESTALGPDPTIVQLTIKRLRMAGEEVTARNPMLAGDTGFRVFRLDSTNIQTWDPDRDNLELTLEGAVDHLKADRSQEDILFELLLKLGLDLCVPIERREIAGKEVHAVGGGVLLVCLAPAIAREDADALAQGIVAWHAELAPGGDATCVFRDSAFADDVAKTNLAAILDQHGLKRVRSL